MAPVLRFLGPSDSTWRPSARQEPRKLAQHKVNLRGAWTVIRGVYLRGGRRPDDQPRSWPQHKVNLGVYLRGGRRPDRSHEVGSTLSQCDPT